MEFKDQLNKYMNELDCSAKTLAEVSTLSPTVVSRYRNGERVPSAGSEQIKKEDIITVLGCRELDKSNSEMYTVENSQKVMN